MGREVFAASIVLAVAASLLLLSGSFEGNNTARADNDVADAVNKGLDFLHKGQLDYGEFTVYSCNRHMGNCELDSTPFGTAFVLYSISSVGDERVDHMAGKGLDFLLGEEEPGGLWRYYSSRNPRRSSLEPDLDDTSVVSAVLALYGREFQDNLVFFDVWRGQNGAFLTWPGGYDNSTDCEVNADVLLYLSTRGMSDAQACGYVTAEIMKGNYSCCAYCSVGPLRGYLPLFYAISRAYAAGAECLGDLRDSILSDVWALQNDDGSFGNGLDTALALNVLLDFEHGGGVPGQGGLAGSGIRRGVESLLAAQSADGSWPRACLYTDAVRNCYGSEDLTTALALEALEKYGRTGSAA